MALPDFYTFLTEGDVRSEFPTIFECFQVKPLKYETGENLLLALINPTFVRRDGSKFDKLIFLNRDHNETLFPIKKWPIKVYVLLPLIESIDTKNEIMGNECIGIGWAELYWTEDSARHEAFSGADWR